MHAGGRKPPDVEGDVWLDAVATALVLRLSPTRVNQLAAEVRLPFTEAGRRRWFRRSHIEHIASARAACQCGPTAARP